MIVKPKEYNNNLNLGGYYLNDVEYTDDIILYNWELSTETKILPNNLIYEMIYEMVNNINSVAFKVNYNVLEFILNNNLKYKFYTDPNFIHPLSQKSKLTKKKKEKEELESFNIKKDLEQNILGLVIIFTEVDSFYIPTRLDYRGRLYCISEYFNYQSIDLAKSLLQFSKE
jgi:DNA-directed RNA polymerase